MKKIALLVFTMCLFVPALSQPYSYDVEMRNFQQIDETRMQWDIYLKAGQDSDPFALYSMQIRWSYNSSLTNTGDFITGSLTIDHSNTELFQNTAGWFTDAHFSKVDDANELNWAVINAPNPDDIITVIDNTWRKVATFQAQLRKDGNPQNFASIDPEFAFELSGVNLIVRRCDDFTGTNPDATMVGGDNSVVDRSSLSPALGVPINDRELAGYMFYGGTSDDWTNNANWNTTTTENSTAPTAVTDNVIIAGEVNVTGTHEVNQLTVAEGAYLKIAPTGRLQAGLVYNDNQVEGGDKGNRSAVTIAKWDFEDENKRVDEQDYSADAGLLEDVALLTNNDDRRLFYREFPSESGNYGSVWDGPRANDYFEINTISTIGYNNLLLSYRQIIDQAQDGNRASKYEVRGSIDGGSSWMVIKAEYDLDWNLFEEEDLALPGSFSNQSNILVRWVDTDGGADKSWHFIDDIVLKGTEIETGILVESSVDNQGQLIHDGVGIEAVVQQYIPVSLWRNKDANKLINQADWYWIASPVVGQDIVQWLDEALGEGDHNSGNVDLYRWEEAENLWRNYHGDNFGQIEFQVGEGYLYATNLQDATYVYAGPINVADLNYTNLTYTDNNNQGWHLIGNSYSSGLQFAGWTTDNVEATPSFYVEPESPGKDGKGNGGSYDIYEEDEIIPPMRAFFMKVNNASNSLIIPASAREFYDAPAKEQPSPNYIRLLAQPVDGTTGQRTYVRLAPNTSEGYDHRYDATFRAGLAPRFYSVKQNHNLIVNAVPEIHEDLVIPYAFRKNNEGDNFRIALQDGIDGWQLYLKDLKLDIVHKLTMDNPYIFISQANDHPMRFELHFSPVEDEDPTSTDDPTTSTGLGNVWTYDENLYIHSTEEGMLVNVFDISGRQVRSYLASIGQQSVRHSLPAGIYMVRLTGQNQTKTVKVVVR